MIIKLIYHSFIHHTIVPAIRFFSNKHQKELGEKILIKDSENLNLRIELDELRKQHEKFVNETNAAKAVLKKSLGIKTNE